MNPLIVTFSGLDGAGKTTQIAALRRYLANQGISSRVLAFWDEVAVLRGLRSGFSRRVLESDGRVGTPENPARRQDKNNQHLALLLGRSFLHMLDLFRLRQVVKRLKREAPPPGVIIFDRYIYDQLAALPLEHWAARSYAQALLKLAPRPDLCYLLDAEPEAACQRKPEYPLVFMHLYRRSYLELCRLTELELIPALEPESVHAMVVARFEALSPRVFVGAEVGPAEAA